MQATFPVASSILCAASEAGRAAVQATTAGCMCLTPPKGRTTVATRKRVTAGSCEGTQQGRRGRFNKRAK